MNCRNLLSVLLLGSMLLLPIGCSGDSSEPTEEQVQQADQGRQHAMQGGGHGASGSGAHGAGAGGGGHAGQ